VTEEELQAQAREIVARSRRLGWLPEKPDPAALARTAALIIQVQKERNRIAAIQGSPPEETPPRASARDYPQPQSSRRTQARGARRLHVRNTNEDPQAGYSKTAPPSTS
jgi:hypothetical protein